MTVHAPISGETPVLRALAAICDSDTAALVERALSSGAHGHIEMLDGGARAAARFIAASVPPQLLIVDLSDSDDPLAALDALAALCPTETRVIAIGTVNDIALYQALRAIGVSEYLVKPLDPTALGRAFDAARAMPEAVPAIAARSIALIGARGGVGTSSLALSVAWVLAQRQRVTLLDLDLHFGSLALGLDLPTAAGLVELLASPDRVDALLIGAAMVSGGERLALLAAEAPLERGIDGAEGGGGNSLPALLAALTASTDTVVIDVPRRLDSATRLVLRTVDQLAIVTDLSLAGLRDTRRLLALGQSLRAGARPLVIANRMQPGNASHLPRAEFERGIGGRLDAALGDDAAMAAAAAVAAQPLAAHAGRQRQAFDTLAALLAGISIDTAPRRWWQRR